METAFYIYIFVFPFIISTVLIPVIIQFSHKNGLYDKVDARKVHKGKISRLGGLAIFAGFVSGFICLLIYDFQVQFNIVVFIIALLLAFFTGFIDDVITIRAMYKLLLQLVCGLLVALSGLKITKVTLFAGFDVQFGILSYLFTMVWVAGFMNAINMLDGMDGLASGIVLVASMFLGIMGWLQGIPIVTYLCVVLIGAILGFLLYNYPPAKIFMGDGGAYFLGFIYAVLPLIGIKKASTITIFSIPIILLLIPLIDVINVMRKRINAGYHIFIADRNHIHHRLLKIGFSNEGILWVMYSYTVILGGFAVLMLYLSPLHAIILTVFLFMLTILTFYIISVAEKRIEELEGRSVKQQKTQKIKTLQKVKNSIIYKKLFT
ncbi:MAG TPA: MraY family glycosyltransferase [Spirochaetota bacterium]|nr:MraY family glycosyltransferase [Spirochaetota bacterium]HOM10451.1 MraY family glycosyltransferase [Spirochaetota bacterium]HPP50198.1 MraY family glycosyltransferase [Spirochaetota bacterium]